MNLTGTAYHPAFGQPVNYQAVALSQDHEEQVAQTIGAMKRFALEDSTSEPIARDAQLMDTGSGDPCSDAFWWAKNKIRFQQDEETAAPIRSLLDDDVIEVLIRPRDVANMGAAVEDCDGFSSYVASLLLARGVPCSFVTVAADARDPERFSHVYLACYPNGQRVAIDASHGEYPGWECPNLFGKKQEWPIDSAGFIPNCGEIIAIAVVLAGAYLLASSAGIL